MMKRQFFFFIFFFVQLVYSQNFQVKEITISAELIGDLYKTKNSKTIVLLIAGSGPTDRNGNSSLTQNNSLKFLAENLAKQNFDVFTYDKRVVYLLKNKKKIPTLDFRHGIDDAITIANYLKNNLKYKNIVITGHSEGSLIGMVAAQKNATAFISLAGAGKTIDKILSEQIIKQAPILVEENEKILKQLKAGQKVTNVFPLLKSLYSEQNQPFIIEWIQIDPTKEIAKLEIPVLIINGTKDIQVGEENAELLHQAQPKATKVIIKNMNHIFKQIDNDSENMASYNNPKLPIQPELIEVIVKFLKSNIK
ncbi:MAG: alpha/beta hydrolase [Capnocytophaga sp.]|nr:alpha/beta hydrolase [Capnocytophaga sp.]